MKIKRKDISDYINHWGKFYDYDDSNYIIGELKDMEDNGFITSTGHKFKYFEAIFNMYKEDFDDFLIVQNGKFTPEND